MKISLVFLIFILISPLSATGQSEGSGDFNQALEHYNNEEFDESLSLLENHSPLTRDRDLNRLRLLSANTYQMAKRSGDVQDFSNALNHINRSIGYLTRILELEGSEVRDKNNLEIALKYKEVLENQEASSQDSSQNNQSVEDELNDLANEQENLAQDSDKSSEEHQQSQQELNNRTEELSNKSNQDSSDFQDEMEKAREAQNKASEAMSEGRFDEAGQHQQEAANHLQRAQARFSEQKNENKEDKSEDMSDQLIQSILDNERDSNPEDQVNRGTGIAVERNW